MASPRSIRVGALALALAATSACGGAGGGLGNVLGSVLGGGQAQPSTVSGTVLGVNQSQINLQLQNGQQVALAYDQQTTVAYQNRSYQVANLERGDQVTVQVQDQGNGAYYVSAVQVDQSAQNGGTVNGNNGGAGSNSVQSIQGTVQQVDTRNGLFTLDAGNGYSYTVSLPYNVSRADSDRFRALRQGDRVRFYGVALNNTRIELRNFY